MTLEINSKVFQQVVNSARAGVANQPDAAKWNRAIDRAVELLETNPWIERDGTHGIIVAGNNGESYQANGQCSCVGYVNGHTHCKHRVLAKLIKRHDEALARLAEQPPVNWPKDRATSKPLDWYAAKAATERPSYTQALAEVNELFA